MIKISFPHIGDYYMPISRFLKDIFPEAEVFPAPKITRNTIEAGSRNSPDFVCSPFKYNMGNFIEALEAGANVLLQTGMGCRYGYYGPVQEQILRDMGYDFTFICVARDKAKFSKIYGVCKKLNPGLKLEVFLKALLLALNRIRIMDKLDYIFRETIGFANDQRAFEKDKESMLLELMEADTRSKLHSIYKKYLKIYKSTGTNIPENILRVGVVGELYTLMEPYSNHYLEKQLAKSGIAVSRKMSVSFLFFGKHDGISLLRSDGYLKHTVGANGVDSVAQCIKYAKKGYDGILHIKSFGCTPELNAQPALINISHKMDIPIMHMSFDAQTSDTGVQTRIEAFTDMIKMKRDRNYEKNSQPGSGRGVHIH